MSLIELTVYIIIFSTSVLATLAGAFDIVLDSHYIFFKIIDAYALFPI